MRQRAGRGRTVDDDDFSGRLLARRRDGEAQRQENEGRIQTTNLVCGFRIDGPYHSGESDGDLRDRGNIYGRMRRRRSDSSGCDLNNVVAHSIEHEFADGVQPEFAHDVAAMRLRRLYTEVEVNRDFLCRFAFGEQLDDSRSLGVRFGSTFFFWVPWVPR